MTMAGNKKTSLGCIAAISTNRHAQHNQDFNNDLVIAQNDRLALPSSFLTDLSR